MDVVTVEPGAAGVAGREPRARPLRYGFDEERRTRLGSPTEHERLAAGMTTTGAVWRACVMQGLGRTAATLLLGQCEVGYLGPGGGTFRWESSGAGRSLMAGCRGGPVSSARRTPGADVEHGHGLVAAGGGFKRGGQERQQLDLDGGLLHPAEGGRHNAGGAGASAVTRGVLAGLAAAACLLLLPSRLGRLLGALTGGRGRAAFLAGPWPLAVYPCDIVERAEKQRQ